MFYSLEGTRQQKGRAMPNETKNPLTPREKIEHAKEICRETEEMANNLDGVSANDILNQQMKSMSAGLEITSYMSQTNHQVTEEEKREMKSLRYKTAESCDNLLAAYCKKHGIKDVNIITLPEIEQKMRKMPGGTA